MRSAIGWICATVLLCSQFAACGGLGENKTPCEAIYDALWRGQRDYCSGESGCCACECINQGQEYEYYIAADGCNCEAREALTEDGCHNLLVVYGS